MFKKSLRFKIEKKMAENESLIKADDWMSDNTKFHAAIISIDEIKNSVTKANVERTLIGSSDTLVGAFELAIKSTEIVDSNNSGEKSYHSVQVFNGPRLLMMASVLKHRSKVLRGKPAKLDWLRSLSKERHDAVSESLKNRVIELDSYELITEDSINTYISIKLMKELLRVNNYSMPMREKLLALYEAEANLGGYSAVANHFSDDLGL